VVWICMRFAFGNCLCCRGSGADLLSGSWGKLAFSQLAHSFSASGCDTTFLRSDALVPGFTKRLLPIEMVSEV